MPTWVLTFTMLVDAYLHRRLTPVFRMGDLYEAGTLDGLPAVTFGE